MGDVGGDVGGFLGSTIGFGLGPAEGIAGGIVGSEFESEQQKAARRMNERDRSFGELGFGNPDRIGARAFADQRFQNMDEFGFTDVLPDARAAPDVQLLANRRVAERNDRLLRDALQSGRRDFSEAQGRLREGLSNLSTYREGGAAAMASGFYQAGANTSIQQAGFNLQGALARRTEAPDLMFEQRQSQIDRARGDAQTAQAIGVATSLAGTAIGAFTGTGGLGGGGGGGGGGQVMGPTFAGNQNTGVNSTGGNFQAGNVGGGGGGALVPGGGGGGGPTIIPGGGGVSAVGGAVGGAVVGVPGGGGGGLSISGGTLTPGAGGSGGGSGGGGGTTGGSNPGTGGPGGQSAQAGGGGGDGGMPSYYDLWRNGPHPNFYQTPGVYTISAQDVDETVRRADDTTSGRFLLGRTRAIFDDLDELVERRLTDREKAMMQSRRTPMREIQYDEVQPQQQFDTSRQESTMSPELQGVQDLVQRLQSYRQSVENRGA